MAFLFRGGLIFWIFFTLLNYVVIKYLYTYKIFPFILWAINLTTIYTNDSYHGYTLVSFFHCESLQFLDDLSKHNLVSWHVVFNMTILRMISYGMDKRWSFTNRRFITWESHSKSCELCVAKNPASYCLKYRYDESHPLSDFSFLHYASYLSYTPLFITGPPLPFNAFIS